MVCQDVQLFLARLVRGEGFGNSTNESRGQDQRPTIMTREKLGKERMHVALSLPGIVLPEEWQLHPLSLDPNLTKVRWWREVVP